MLFSSSLVRKSLLTNFSTYEKEVNISIGRENRPALYTNITVIKIGVGE